MQTPEEVASRNEILRVKSGSDVHGCSVSEQDDRDEMGICVEAAEYIVGLAMVSGPRHPVRFQQWWHRTQPEGVRSGPGDLDLVVYSLRKWMGLALGGNPTILIPLFAPTSAIIKTSTWGENLRKNADRILSKQAGQRYLGYLHSQRERLVAGRQGHTNRPELIDQYGFDTKFAYHAARLAIQGGELMSTGTVTLPMPEPDRSWCVALRKGEVSLEEALARISKGEAVIQAHLMMQSETPLRTNPDWGWASKWLVRTYDEIWERNVT